MAAPAQVLRGAPPGHLAQPVPCRVPRVSGEPPPSRQCEARYRRVPLLKKGQLGKAGSVNADFLFHRSGGTSLDGQDEPSGWILLELKTDGSSLDPAQFRQYLSTVVKDGGKALVKHWRMRALDARFEVILSKTERIHRPGYRLIRHLVRKERDLDGRVEVCCIAPIRADEPGVTFYGLRELARWKPKGAESQELWERLTPLLNRLASSAKSRRRT